MTKNQYRSNYCSELNNLVGQKVKLAGWVRTKRDHGSMIFVDLKDKTGVAQCIIDVSEDNFKNIENISLESVISVDGLVLQRPENAFNDKVVSGRVEVKIESIEVLNSSDCLPFAMHQNDVGEELRLKYRFLDLRRDEMQSRLHLRHEVIKLIRHLMESMDFIEVQTPILTSSSPEGARDYVVPSRLNPGKFYALPQAPQQFKQLLMVSGLHRYYQIAPCFRDEDSRADRTAGAFYQLDLEMSFTTQEEVFEVLEYVMFNVFSKFKPEAKIERTFVRIPYEEAILKYGSDKPDLRVDLRYYDVTDLFSENCPKIFEKIMKNGGKVLLLPVKDLHSKSRKFFDDMQKLVQDNGAIGLGYILLDTEVRGPLAKVVSEEVINFIKERGDGAFFIADDISNITKYAPHLIKAVGKEFDLIDEHAYKFCWIVDFPMYEKVEGKWQFSHNPFSMPQGGMEALVTQDPGSIKAFQYDLVCNGIELTSGAIRNHKLEIMYKAFEIVGYSSEDVEKEFGSMINAFKYGAPPHGGAAPGIDRLVMLLAGTENIREIIPFPLSQNGQDLMMNAPTCISSKHLNELGLTVNIDKNK
ncbi:MAG: aspartate--tRNA ligase [Alphaproteobacteria bacterium]|nr:MAG: aspartate--tRNA ligase [Alphaproteobacteria bacterium]